MEQERKHNREQIHKPNLNKFRPVLFWDTDITQIDWEKQKRAIIKRVLERGNTQEITELIKYYGKQEISAELINVRLMRDRSLLYKNLMDLKDDKGEPLFRSEWLKKNILKIDE
jgi:antitoxin HigA-1